MRIALPGKPCLRFFERLEHALFIEGLQQIVDCVDLKGAHGVLVEGCGEDDLRQGHVAIEQLLEHGKAVQAGHLHVQEHEVGLMPADEIDGLDAVGALAQNLHAARVFEQELELLAAERFVVDDEGGQGLRLFSVTVCAEAGRRVVFR